MATKINSVLSNWNVGKLVSYKQTTAGAVNVNWIVKTTSGKYVLRKTTFKNLKELAFELKYLTHLKEHNFPYGIPAPILTKSDKYFLRQGKSNFWLYEYIGGQIKKRFGRPELKEAAKMMATYHTIIAHSKLNNGKITPPFGRTYVLRELRIFRKQVLRKAKPNNKDELFLEGTNKLIPLLESLDAKSYGKLKRYPIHRDLNPENTLWQGHKLVGVIDWENVSSLSDTLVKDVAVMFQYACRVKNYKYKTDLNLAKFFLKEYKKYRQLSNKEISFIPAIIAAGAIEDFSYEYWMLVNDPKRAKASRMKLYPKVALWHYENRDKIKRTLSQEPAG